MSSSQQKSYNSKVNRYWEKKISRSNHKQVRYGCRQNLAKQRFRHQGRFIKKEDRDKLDPDQIYDPNVHKMPRIKPIFKISKEHNRSSSCCSSSSNYKVSSG